MQFSIKVHTVWLFPEPYNPHIQTQNGASDLIYNRLSASSNPKREELEVRRSKVQIRSLIEECCSCDGSRV